MNPMNLIKMANQIGAFFEAMPNREQAARGVADHILRSWEPRMRSRFFEYVDSRGEAELKPVVREALSRMRNP